MTEFRSGLGFDLHPLVEGQPLVLGGVTVPATRGLGGHSDADVLTHAVIDAALVGRVLAAAAGGAATCGIPVRETVKRVQDGAIEATIPRQGLWLTQTPQAFTRAVLWEAHDKARRDGFAGTDDAVLVERLGMPVAMVAGLAQNLKITTREDLRTARSWVRPRRPE